MSILFDINGTLVRNVVLLIVDFTPTPLLGSRCWHPIMWVPPPEPPKPKKKKTRTDIDEQGNEVVVELSEDESSDKEEEVFKLID